MVGGQAANRASDAASACRGLCHEDSAELGRGFDSEVKPIPEDGKTSFSFPRNGVRIRWECDQAFTEMLFEPDWDDSKDCRTLFWTTCWKVCCNVL